MMSEYATYTKFYAPEDAQYLITLLQQHAIPYTLEHEVNQLDKVYLGETIEAMFALKVPGNRFNDIHGLLAAQAKADFAQPGFDHYLQTYTATELREYLNDPIGWNGYDSQVAQMLLVEKTGEEIVVQPVNGPVAFEPVKIDNKYLALAYLACILGLYFVYLSVAGFFAGLAITQAKKTLQNGNTVKLYTPEARNHGQRILIIGLVCTIVSCIIFYFSYMK